MRVRKTLKKLGLGGFTLAELIVVITVLAILATIGFLALAGYSQDAKDSAIKTNVRSVYSAIMAEGAATGKSPRYYVVHDPSYALSGGIVVFDGWANALSWGDWDEPGTNYSAGNPDYVKLRINKEKFKISYDGLGMFQAFAAWTADPDYLLVWAADFSENPQNGTKARVKSYVQVVGTNDAKIPSVIGNFPVGSSTWSVLGLVRDVGASSSTWAIVDGVASWDPIPCAVPQNLNHSGLSYALSSTWSLEHGKTESRTGSATFWSSPTNGTLTAGFSVTCNNWSVTATSSNGTGNCQSNYSWNGSWTTPSCSQTSFGFTQTIGANAANYNLKNQAIAAGWNQTLPLNATVTVNGWVTVYSNSPSIAAFTVGTLPAGSVVNLVNNGGIYWAGGNGGNGNGNHWANGWDAISLAGGVTLNLSNAGYVFGWGGGGGGWAVRTNTNVLAWGGGGGGGQGYVWWAGWAGGDAYAGAQYPYGYAGSAWSLSAAWAGGSPWNSGYYPNQWAGGYCIAWVGGNGGWWWSPGGTGWVGSGWYCPNYTPGNGWAGGNAVRLNGATVNWISWNSPSQVKGNVN